MGNEGQPESLSERTSESPPKRLGIPAKTGNMAQNRVMVIGREFCCQTGVGFCRECGPKGLKFVHLGCVLSVGKYLLLLFPPWHDSTE